MHRRFTKRCAKTSVWGCERKCSRAWTHGKVTTLISGCRSCQLHIPSTMCEIKPFPIARYDAALAVVQKCCPQALLMLIPPRRPKELGTDAEVCCVDPLPLLCMHRMSLHPSLAFVCTSRSPAGIRGRMWLYILRKNQTDKSHGCLLKML